MPEAIRDRIGGLEPENREVDHPDDFLPSWTLKMARVVGQVIFERDRVAQFYVLGLDRAPKEVLGKPPLPRSVFRVVEFQEDDLTELKRRRFVAHDEGPEDQW